MSEVLIDGSWGPAQSGAELVVTNPATLKPVASAPFCDAQDVVRAMAAARRALESWSASSRDSRVAVLHEVSRVLEASAPGIAELQALESGQPYVECLDAVLAAAACFAQAGRPNPGVPSASRHANPQVPAASSLPLGAEYPLLTWACRSVPLLVQGCTLVCLAPRTGPLSVLRAARCAAALPRGVLNVVVTTPEAARAGLGGLLPEEQGSAGADASDAVFVTDGADLERTLKGSASLRLFNSGQRAGQSARIYVEERTSGELADRLHEYLAFLECGDPRNCATDLGPLRSLAALQKVEDQVGRALKRGALLKVGGRRYQPWGLRGFFFQPTLMIEGRGEERVPDGEIPGPVVVISPVRNLAEAVAQDRLRRIRCFGGGFDAQLQSLTAAGVDFEVAEVTSPLQRIMQDLRGMGSAGLSIERGAGEDRSGFPYRARQLAS